MFAWESRCNLPFFVRVSTTSDDEKQRLSIHATQFVLLLLLLLPLLVFVFT